MKRAVCMLLTLLCFVIGGCSVGETGYSPSRMTKGFDDKFMANEVVMSINQPVITSNTAEIEIIIKNKTSLNRVYTEEPYIEVFVDGAWYAVDPKEDAQFSNAEYSIGAGETQNYIFDIGGYYDLKSGYKYRLIKLFGDSLSSVRFDVED